MIFFIYLHYRKKCGFDDFVTDSQLIYRCEGIVALMFEHN